MIVFTCGSINFHHVLSDGWWWWRHFNDQIDIIVSKYLLSICKYFLRFSPMKFLSLFFHMQNLGLVVFPSPHTSDARKTSGVFSLTFKRQLQLDLSTCYGSRTVRKPQKHVLRACYSSAIAAKEPPTPGRIDWTGRAAKLPYNWLPSGLENRINEFVCTACLSVYLSSSSSAWKVELAKKFYDRGKFCNAFDNAPTPPVATVAPSPADYN